ncbi:MAG: hypothetical protein HQM01_13105 [Magnetococcales bacterium]|nr:hypothetical protein [Magnetococcales bacterium]
MVKRGWIQQDILTTMGDDEEWSIAALRQNLQRDSKSIARAVSRLFKRGLILRISAGVYALSNSGAQYLASGKEILSGSKNKKAKTVMSASSFRQRFWNGLSNKTKPATLDELLQICSRPEDKAPVSNAVRFLQALERTGFIQKMDRKERGAAPTSNGFDRWKLLRKTGLYAPIVREEKREVYDRNTGKTYPMATQTVAIDTPLTGNDITKLAEIVSGYRERGVKSATL